MNSSDKMMKVLKKQGLDLFVLSYDPSNKIQQIAQAERQFHDHPAREQLRILLKRYRDENKEGFWRLATGTSTKFLQWGPRTKSIATIGMDVSKQRSNFEKRLLLETSIGSAVLHFKENILDSLTISKTPLTNKILYRLFSDVFAAYRLISLGYKGFLPQMVKEKAMSVFERNPGVDPSYNMMAIYSDRLVKAFKEKGVTPIRNKNTLNRVLDTVQSVIGEPDTRHVLRWKDFVDRAQDMAWRGYSPREILVAAVSGSESPYLQEIGRRLARVCDIELPTGPVADMEFNAFATDEENEARHVRDMKMSFADALQLCLKTGHSDYFYKKADEQNERLMQGKFVGWCAKALQNSADFFDKLTEQEEEFVGTKVKEKFLKEIQKKGYGWHKLKSFSDKMIGQIKEGMVVTHGFAIEAANENNFKLGAQALQMSLDGPEMQENLEFAPAPKTPTMDAPSMAPEQSASPKAVNAPSMAMGGNGGGRVRTTIHQNTSDQSDQE